MELKISKKKVLSFIDWYSPGYKAGGGQRAFANFVDYMRDEYDFYIITRNVDFLESTPYAGITSDIWFNRNVGENVYYASEKSIGLKLYKRLLKQINPDFIYINGVYSFKFSILPLILLKVNPFKACVLQSTYGMLAQSAINIKKGKKQIFLTLAQFMGLYKKVVFHATSEGEKEDIFRVFGHKALVKIAPHFPEKRELKEKSILKEKGQLRLISVARIAPEKNTLYALQCIQMLENFEGQVVFDLYGPIYDHEYWNACKEVINQLPVNINVSYRGVLNGDEVIDRIQDYHCLFLPSRGENFAYVVLEAFMAGRPVLISDCTPWRNLQQKKAGYDLPLDAVSLFCKVIKQMLTQDHLTFDILCDGAKKSATEFVKDPNLLAVNMQLFENCT